MTKDSAARVASMFNAISDQLVASVDAMRGSESEETSRSYAAAIGKILGEIMYEVLKPIYREHPDLAPADLK